MPVLNALCTCERIIIDTKGIPSLISLFQRMDLQLTETTVPEDLVVPARWVVFCLWQLAPEEVGTEFVQHTKIVRPNGVLFHETQQAFRLQGDSDLHVRTFIELNGMHVGHEGNHRIQVWLDGREDDVREITFFIRHLPIPEPVANQQIAASTN
jgi:hypothetical protein